MYYINSTISYEYTAVIAFGKSITLDTMETSNLNFFPPLTPPPHFAHSLFLSDPCSQSLFSSLFFRLIRSPHRITNCSGFLSLSFLSSRNRIICTNTLVDALSTAPRRDWKTFTYPKRGISIEFYWRGNCSYSMLSPLFTRPIVHRDATSRLTLNILEDGKSIKKRKLPNTSFKHTWIGIFIRFVTKTNGRTDILHYMIRRREYVPLRMYY